MASKLVRKVCFLNKDRDARVLEWLQSQGSESAAIRAALWAYLDQPAEVTPPASVDLTVLHQLLETLPNLVAIRQVVDAAVKTALIGLTLTPPAGPPQADEETDLTLDDLNDNLVLG